ncbi:MAG: BamA/TamA family outer membrane protein [Flavobacteriaceae bacterium]|nr:BamA/TamA family outer membrane protein [Flavobacteriaceae bacterium]
MAQTLTKISLFLGLTTFFVSCNAVKRLSEDELLLTENTIIVDGEKMKDGEEYSLLTQKPNPKIPVLGIPFGLHIYNIAEPKPDSTYQAWLHRKPKRLKRLTNLLSRKQVDGLGQAKVDINDWLKRTGSAPVIIDDRKAKKSLAKLKRYYFTKGWFNVDGDFSIIKDSVKEKRGSITYRLRKFRPYIIDSISEKISSPIVDSLFQNSKNLTFIRPGRQYDATDFENEIDRLTIQFRNSGLYYFDQDYIGFDADTNDTGHRIHIDYIIPDRRITQGDTTASVPFQIHKINDVRIITDYSYSNRNKNITDSVAYKGYKIYGYEELKYRPKAITDAISITPGEIFRDIDRTLTYNQLSELRNFRYPNISYQEDPADSSGQGLISTILLTPRKKYTLDFNFDTYTSTIQQFGIGFSTSFLIRNVFRGAENLELSARGSVGSSKDNADTSSKFFNTSDVGADAKLTFPSILFPINTDKLIPKYMSPFTSISMGFNAQNNIGLDRQNFNGIFSYKWKPRTIRTNSFDLANVQYVRNLRTSNYFNVYVSSYDRLNEIARAGDYTFENTELEPLELGLPDEANQFLVDATQNSNPFNLSEDDFEETRSIGQRKERLTEDNLIFASTFNWTRDTRENISDKSFTRLRFKVEAAGNLLSSIAGIANLKEDSNGRFRIFGVEFSQYVKFETDFIRHWEVGNNSIFAIRTFGGIAIPYGNSNSIPFTRSYFAGGANDNRGWRAYDLGPGSSGGVLDFNEANFKLAFNAEYRFTLLGSFKGAFFVDTGNIWNIADDTENPAFVFNGLSDLSEIAVASGIGLRYDFGFFVLRFDTGFKTYDPSLPEGARWFKAYNFRNAVYNIGINYPF